ncbi:CheR methyltransferase, all-alpha domain [Cohaesibacter marisflavi]|uniref:histidine kinase n=1 Tax=Cohaesibacter marisflavi TaxID=655353 RepID=A0A1I5IJW2_9HYPH|nr:CheR family methyltransferase [Cohaesibacter marisflavi]SFO60887.1 CheR methyltransferase, all-alpha domain [Cohaesibacter marisflavi]
MSKDTDSEQLSATPAQEALDQKVQNSSAPSENTKVDASEQLSHPPAEETALDDPQTEPGQQGNTIRIVAIGASAGGLEPIEQFFDALPTDPNVAFVIIQHLSPNFQSMMDQLIARHTHMRIVHAEDQMAIEPNVIYLNPPRTELSVKEGKLSATAYPDNDMLSLPIDAFFTSLAKEEGEHAIGIVLSGTGSDGTRGSLQIVQHGGVVIAQEPSKAKFDSMPRKVIDTINTAYVADVTDMPEILAAVISGSEVPRPEPEAIDTEIGNPESRILAILQKSYGTDFTFYKNATIHRRIQRRALLKREASLDKYCESLLFDKEEMDTLYCDLLIGVTEFFRDKEAFEAIKSKVLPDLVANMTEERQIRIWVPGCATGEEAYSIAILVSEIAKRNGITPNLKIFATDIHFRSLEIAAEGSYNAESVAHIPETLLKTYFDFVDNRYQVKKSLRRKVVFSTQNLLKDPPFTKIDLVTCRNLLIYFNELAQRKVLSLFHFALKEKGHLFLGSSETVGNLDEEFTSIDKRWRIFQKKHNSQIRDAAFLMPATSRSQEDTENGLSLRETRSHNLAAAKKESLTRQALYGAYDRLLERYAPTGFLINDLGELMHIFGNADKFLQVRKGLFSNRITDLVQTDLKLAITSGIERAMTINHEPDFERSVQIKESEDNLTRLTIRVTKILNVESHSVFLLITLEERKSPLSERTIKNSNAPILGHEEIYVSRIAELENELRSTGESLQTTIEELETSNEELQATNEELTASNEELQSTNEELHSVNEELYTVSAEHQRKIVELTEMTDDMENLLRSTQIGTIFLDEEARIRRFTPASTKAFNLMPHDVGRPIGHVTCRFDSTDLLTHTQETITRGTEHSREVECDGIIYLLNILPYKTELETITGAVITVFEIDELKRAQERVKQEREFYKTVVDLQSDLICRFKPDTTITYANSAFHAFFDITPDAIKGTLFKNLLKTPQKEDLVNAIENLEQDVSIEWEFKQADKSSKWLQCRFNILRDEHGAIFEIQAVLHNVTEIVERENLISEFNRIAASTNLDLNDKIERILTRVSEVSRLPAALKISFENQQIAIDTIIGMKKGKLSVGQTFSTPCASCQHALTSDEGIPYRDYFIACIVRTTDIFHSKGYQTVIGAPTISNGEANGAILLASKFHISKSYLENYQPIVDRIADWIGYELFRRDQQEKLEMLNNMFMEEEERFRKLYMETPVIMHSLDKDGIIVEANEEWLTTLGYEREDVIGHHWEEFMTEASTQYAYEVVLPETTKNKQADNVPFQMVKKDGGIIDVEMSTIIVADGKGVEQTRTVLADVSDRVRAEKELEAHNQELKLINENLNQFTHIISHDLAGPLRAIQHTATWIEEDLDENTQNEIQEHIDRLKDQISHLGSLIADLSDYSKAGSNVQEAEEIHLTVNLQSIFDIVDGSDAIRFETSLPQESILTYRAPLLLVLRNLIENAIKYHDKDNGIVKVWQEDLGDAWAFAVCDDGPGIDPKHHGKILLPFRKLERKDKVPGNGMGLALVKKAIESVGGTLTILSDPSIEPGTTFRFTWPKQGK